MSHKLARAIRQVADLLGLDAESPIPVVLSRIAADSDQGQDKKPDHPLARFSREGISASRDDLCHILPQLGRIAGHARSAKALVDVAHACGLTQEYWREYWQATEAHLTADALAAPSKEQREATHLKEQWEYLLGRREPRMGDTDGEDALAALMALHEMGARPDVIFLDDLPYLSSREINSEEGRQRVQRARDCWHTHMARYSRLFTVHCPPLPLQHQHELRPEPLYPFLAWELSRLARPTAAVIDLRWYSGDTGSTLQYFGLELIRMVRAMRPRMPIFVWSNVSDGPVLQDALQLGANYYFNKEGALAIDDRGDAVSSADSTYSSGHGDPGRQANFLNPGKLWFHIWAWEIARYAAPLRDAGAEPFLSARTPEQENNRKRVMTMVGLKPADLNRESRNDAARLLRALLPDAQTIEILHVLGGGVSGSFSPFIAQGRTDAEGGVAEGGFLKPVQVKLTRDWRALARERKGYHNVIQPTLGPAAAQVLRGPYRVGEWCGMVQSYAAPEEAYGAPSTRGTRSLSEVLSDHLHAPAACERIAQSVFEAVLRPFYAGRTYREDYPCQRAFAEVSPPHLIGYLVPWDGTAELHDFSAVGLSRKNEKARREAAGRKWRALMGDGQPSPLFLEGLQIDTLECDGDEPSRSRLRLIEPTLGVKVDLFPDQDDPDVAKWWSYLERSPIKLRGQPVTVGVRAQGAGELVLGDGWCKMLEKAARDHGLRGARSLCTVGEDGGSLPGVEFLLTFHPIDHCESFLLGPVHGDLNLRNILLHEKAGAFFPWLIDFDRTQRGFPIVFDLVKLEVEAFHQVGAGLFHELARQCGLSWYEQPQPIYTLPHFVAEFEQALEDGHTRAHADEGRPLDHLWARLDQDGRHALPSQSLRDRFTGFFRYLQTVRDNVWKLGVKNREYQLARLYYSLCCLKFGNLYDRRQSRHAPFAAQLLLYKLQYTARLLDRENGIDPAPQTCHADARIIASLIERIRHERRLARSENRPQKSFGDLMDDLPMLDSSTGRWAAKLSGRRMTVSAQQILRVSKFERTLRILRNRAIPGENAWFREVLWYVRDAGEAGLGTPEQLAAFTIAMALASQDPGDDIPRLHPERLDFASTGRVANTWPTQKMLEHLAMDPPEFVKISSRGESGGTIDMLEQAGLTICRSPAAVEDELRRSRWAVAEAGSHLCEVDRILMEFRKACGCMKVGDLVISSISAKKIAVGISHFEVQVATGYDAKFENLLDGEKNSVALQERWNRMWSEICTLLGSDAEDHAVRLGLFDSNSLDPQRVKALNKTPVIVGGVALASILYDELSRKKSALKEILPEEFKKRAGSWCESIESLRRAQPAGAWDLGYVTNRSTVFRKARWGAFEPLDGEMAGMGALLLDLDIDFKASGTERIPLHVERLDGLYGELSRNGDPRTSIVIFSKRIVILVPAAELRRRNVDLWAWQVLRECFGEALEELRSHPVLRDVTVLGPGG